MDALDLRNDLLNLLHFEQTASAPVGAKDDIATALNRAFQEIFLRGPDFFRRSEKSFNTVAATQAYTLTDDVQEVLEPVRIGLNTLQKVLSKGDILQWDTRFNGSTSVSASSGQPVCFYTERLNNGISHTDQEMAQVKIWLAPIPDDVYSVELEVAIEPPTYTRANFCDDPTPELPIPHKYVESLLLPVARYFVTDSHYFTDLQKLKGLEQGFTRAFENLGIADPIPPPLAQSVAKAKPR